MNFADVKTLFINGTEVSSLYINGNAVWSKPSMGGDGLRFTANQANSTISMIHGAQAPELALEYSINGGSWETFTPGTTTITLPYAGDYALMRATDSGNSCVSTFISGVAAGETTNAFSMTGSISASDSVMYLLDKDGDATMEGRSCFYALFKSCTALTTAPELPATTLVQSCYQQMFFGCTSLVTAPFLPATTLVTACYTQMFYGCSSLNSIKLAYTGNIATYFSGWVNGVSASGTFYYNGSYTTRGVSAIPTGWTIQTF